MAEQNVVERTNTGAAILRGVTMLFALAFGSAALWSSTYVVKPNEAGVILAFGKVTSVAPPGMHMTLPWPFGDMIRVNTSSVDRISVGFRILDRERGLQPTEDMVQWLTGDTNIVELQAVVLYTIQDPRKFLFEISDSGEEGWLPLPEPQRTVVRRAADAVLTRRIARMSIDELLLEGKVELQTSAVDEIQSMLDMLDAGIHVSAVQIQSVAPPKIVIETFNDVQSARSDRERRISEADGYKLDTIPKARGIANSLEQEAETYRTEQLNRAKGVLANFDKLRDEVSRNRDVVMRQLWIDTMQKILKKARIIQVPAGAPQSPAQRLFIEAS